MLFGIPPPSVPRESGGTLAVLASDAVAANLRCRWADDRRRLGIAIRRLEAQGGCRDITLPPDHPGLAAGWHAPERRGDRQVWRWTDGAGTIELPPATRLLTVETLC